MTERRTKSGIIIPPHVDYRYSRDDSHEPVKFLTHLLLEKRDADGKLYEIVEHDFNLLLTAGATEIWTKLSLGTGTLWNTTNAQIAVGDALTTPAVGQTDMQAALGATNNTGDITAATNPGNPIVLTVPGWTTLPVVGEVYVVAGVNGNTAANGTWEVASVSTTTMGLLGSSGNGAFTTSAGSTIKKVNKYRQQANAAGSAVITGMQIVYLATFPLANANFAWNEFGVTIGAAAANKQAAPPTLLLSRGLASLGTKGSTVTWTPTVTFALSN